MTGNWSDQVSDAYCFLLFISHIERLGGHLSVINLHKISSELSDQQKKNNFFPS